MEKLHQGEYLIQSLNKMENVHESLEEEIEKEEILKKQPLIFLKILRNEYLIKRMNMFD